MATQVRAKGRVSGVRAWAERTSSQGPRLWRPATLLRAITCHPQHPAPCTRGPGRLNTATAVISQGLLAAHEAATFSDPCRPFVRA
eukprot:4490723-Prymnesium_polylepis.1